MARVATDKRWATPSNVLTILRLVSSPCIMFCMYYQWVLLAFALFVSAAFSDVIDGYLARLRREQSQLGALLDPLADKSLMLAVFGSLAFFPSPLFHVPWWFFAIVTGRELIMILGAIILLWKKNVSIEPLVWGKLTTFFQSVFLLWLFVCHFIGWHPWKTDVAFLILLSFFSLVSLAKYIQRACCESSLT